MQFLLCLLLLLQDPDFKPEVPPPVAPGSEVPAVDSAPPPDGPSGAKTEGQPIEGAAGDPATGETADGEADSGDQADAPPPEGPHVDTEGEVLPPWWERMAGSGAIGFMIDGGIFMWPILVLGILALGVMIERYRSLKLLRTDSGRLRQEVLDLLNAGRVEEAVNRCNQEEGPVAAILAAGLRKFFIVRKLGYDAARTEEQVTKAMDDASVHIVAALEKHLPILATIAAAAPMLGFLGTVQGMVVAFDNIVRQYGEVDVLLAAAAGIKVALLTTVFGLVVGLPAYVAFNYFTGVINTFVLDVEEAGTDLIEAVTFQTAIEESMTTAEQLSVRDSVEPAENGDGARRRPAPATEAVR